MSRCRQIVVVSRQRCELCSELIDLLRPYASADLVQIEERDVDADPALHALHAWRVPVVFEGDEELMWGRIEVDEVVAIFGPLPPPAPPQSA